MLDEDRITEKCYQSSEFVFSFIQLHNKNNNNNNNVMIIIRGMRMQQESHINKKKIGYEIIYEKKKAV